MKDLFRLTFSKVSRFDYADYYGDFVQRAPFWILDSAARAHRDVRDFPDFPMIHSFLRENSATCWNNPELYPHLFRLLRARDGSSDYERHELALQAHLGLRKIDTDIFTHRFFRLHGPSPRTFELVDGEVQTVPDSILSNDKNFPVVYQPVPFLFDDVVGGAASYVGSPIPVSAPEMKRVIQAAADMLRRYDSPLYAGFTEAVGTLAITGDWKPGDRISYSTGSIYTGGIFTSLCGDTPTLLVESLIHEYYHQRLWLWWLIERPADLPEPDTTIVSPVSQQERSVEIMTQALLIYASLCDYYRWATHLLSNQPDWLEARWQTLQSGAAKLLVQLRDVLAGRDESLRFVNAVAEHMQ